MYRQNPRLTDAHLSVYNGFRGCDTMAVRVNITLPEYVLEATDKRAAELGIPRSGYIATALQFKMQYDDMMAQVPMRMQMIQDLRSGKMTPDQMRDALGSSATTVAVPGGVGEA